MTSPSNTISRLLRRDLLNPNASAETVVNAQRDSNDFRVSVNFPSVLRLQKVAAIQVQVEPAQLPAPGLTANRRKSETITLRLRSSGVLIHPADHVVELPQLTPSPVQFYITPLATGKLPAARLEILLPGHAEAVTIPLNVLSTGVWRWAAALILIPLLLWLPMFWPELPAGTVERRLLDSLPRDLGYMRPAARVIENCYSILAQNHFSMSFWALLLVVGGWCLFAFSRRAHTRVVHGEVFRLLTSAKTPTPPAFLTPLTEHEIAEIQQHK
jgi:hypothetical protein